MWIVLRQRRILLRRSDTATRQTIRLQATAKEFLADGNKRRFGCLPEAPSASRQPGCCHPLREDLVSITS
jgi:hypothetical protein